MWILPSKLRLLHVFYIIISCSLGLSLCWPKQWSYVFVCYSFVLLYSILFYSICQWINQMDWNNYMIYWLIKLLKLRTGQTARIINFSNFALMFIFLMFILCCKSLVSLIAGFHCKKNRNNVHIVWQRAPLWHAINKAYVQWTVYFCPRQ